MSLNLGGESVLSELWYHKKRAETINVLTHGTSKADDASAKPAIRSFPSDRPRFAFQLIFADLLGDGGALSKECGVSAGKYNNNRPGLYDDAEYADFGDVSQGLDRQFPRSFVDSYDLGQQRSDRLTKIMQKSSPSKWPQDVKTLCQSIAGNPSRNHQGQATKVHGDFLNVVNGKRRAAITKEVQKYIIRRAVQDAGDVTSIPLMWDSRAHLLSPCQHVRFRLPTMHVMKSIGTCSWDLMLLNMNQDAVGTSSGFSKDDVKLTLIKAVANKKGTKGTKLNRAVSHA